MSSSSFNFHSNKSSIPKKMHLHLLGIAFIAEKQLSPLDFYFAANQWDYKKHEFVIFLSQCLLLPFFHWRVINRMTLCHLTCIKLHNSFKLSPSGKKKPLLNPLGFYKYSFSSETYCDIFVLNYNELYRRKKRHLTPHASTPPCAWGDKKVNQTYLTAKVIFIFKYIYL